MKRCAESHARLSFLRTASQVGGMLPSPPIAADVDCGRYRWAVPKSRLRCSEHAISPAQAGHYGMYAVYALR